MCLYYYFKYFKSSVEMFLFLNFNRLLFISTIEGRARSTFVFPFVTSKNSYHKIHILSDERSEVDFASLLPFQSSVRLSAVAMFKMS